jgi:hypothetical protein
VQNSGKIRIRFTIEIIIPSFSLYPEFLNSELMRNCTFQRSCSSARLLASNKTLSEQEQAVELVNQGIVRKNNSDYPLIEIQIIPSPYEDTR